MTKFSIQKKTWSGTWSASGEKILIGIDPGVHCGFAVYGNLAGLIRVCELSFWETIDELKNYRENNLIQNIEVHLEWPQGNKPTFDRKMNYGSQAKISQNVGANKRDAQLIFEWLEERGIKCVKHVPNASSMTKINAKTFESITGWKEKANEHGRDAAMMVFGGRKTK